MGSHTKARAPQRGVREAESIIIEMYIQNATEHRASLRPCDPQARAGAINGLLPQAT